MKSKGTWQIAVGSAALAATLFVLPTPLFRVASGSADAGATGLFVLGLALLAGGLGSLGYGMFRRSRELNRARSYDTREPSSLDEDRPVNPHAIPKSYGAVPPLP
jgi:predicted phage tail protein